MGCDIHQYNLIWNGSSYELEGEGFVGPGARFNGKLFSLETDEDDWTYHSNYIDELVPYRHYMTFGVLAGVRSDEFEIEDRNDGYPAELLEIMKNDKKTENKITDECHSPVWYYMPDLQKELKKKIHEIRRWMRLIVKKDPYQIHYMDEYDCLVSCLEKMIRQLLEARHLLGVKKYKKSMIIFNFDS